MREKVDVVGELLRSYGEGLVVEYTGDLRCIIRISQFMYVKEYNFKVIHGSSSKCSIVSNNVFQRVLCKRYQVDVLKLHKLEKNTEVKLKSFVLSPIKLQ